MTKTQHAIPFVVLLIASVISWFFMTTMLCGCGNEQVTDLSDGKVHHIPFSTIIMVKPNDSTIVVINRDNIKEYYVLKTK